MCHHQFADVRAVAAPRNASQVRGYLLQAVPSLRTAYRELLALKPPPNRLAAYNALLANLQQTLAIATQLQNALQANNKRAEHAIGREIAVLTTSRQRAAEALRLRDCA